MGDTERDGEAGQGAEGIDGEGERPPAVTEIRPERDDRSRPVAAPDADLDVGERVADRRLGLVHDHLDGVDERVAEHVVGDDLGEPLDEVEGRPGDPGHHGRGDLGVVDRCGQIVGAARSGQVEGQVHVDDERLAVPLLGVEDPVEAAGGDALEDDLVGSPGPLLGHVVLEGRPHHRENPGGRLDVMDADAPQAGHGGHDRGRRRLEVALGGGSRRLARSPAEPPQERLARCTEQDGVAQLVQLGQSGQERPVVIRRLGEAETGVEHEEVLAQPGTQQLVPAGGKLTAYVLDDVVVDGE